MTTRKTQTEPDTRTFRVQEPFDATPGEAS